jgi:predicted Zn-dependent peptidase
VTVQETTLPNGLRIVTANLADSRSVTANIMVGTGSRYEDFKANGGVSHFLEHLLFKGTQKYPSAQAIAEAIDAVGGYNNAFTSEDLTNYFVKVPAKHSKLAIDILCDMMKSPLLEPVEIDRERGVIVEEMNVYRDDPARYIGTIIPQLIFPNNPLGHDIIGTEEVINRLPADEIAAYQRQYYRPGNMVVAVAGKVRHDDVVAEVTAALGDLEPAKTNSFVAVGGKLADDLAVVQAKDTAQAHFIVASRAYEYDHPDDAAAKLMTAILGRGMSSRLFTNVRERQGLAYTVYSDLNNYVDTGIFHAYAGVNLDKIDQAVESVLAELANIRLEPVAAAELDKAKQQLEASLDMSLESNSAIAERIGTQLILTGRVKTIEEIMATYEQVTLDDIQRVAGELLAPDKLRFAIIAPEPDGPAERFKQLVAGKGVK